MGTIGVRQLGLYSLDIVRGTGTTDTHSWELQTGWMLSVKDGLRKYSWELVEIDGLD